MTVPARRPPPSLGHWDWKTRVGCALLVAGTLAVYGRTFSVPGLLDDESAILTNATIRHFGTAWLPPENTTPSGRPILNLSFALNYAISGTRLGSYHAFNLGVHLLAAITLFGLVRRLAGGSDAAARRGIALGSALLWALHPIQTESVTYVAQRAESLMGLFYLQTIYWFVRARPSSGNAGLFGFLSVASCLLGMATKEVMVSAPLVVLLLDRAYFAGSFGACWRLRRRYYSALAATWIPLGILVWRTGNRSGNSGFGSGVSVWQYWATQPEAILRYLKLTVWPSPLVFDYGTQWLTDAVHPATARAILVRLAAPACVLAGLAFLTMRGLARNTVAGVLGFFFFAILAPTSVIPGNRQTAADHRMYVALIPLAAIAVEAVHRRFGRRAEPAVAAVAICLGAATLLRNEVYSSAVSIWSDTVAQVPENRRARNNLAVALAKVPGKLDEAIGQYEEILRRAPGGGAAGPDLLKGLAGIPGSPEIAVRDYAEIHNNLGNALARTPGRMEAAIIQYREAIRLMPPLAQAHYNLANALAGKPAHAEEAVAEYREAIRLNPNYAAAHVNLGRLLATEPGKAGEAAAHFRAALRVQPELRQVHLYLADACTRITGGWDDAIAHYREAIRQDPDSVEARYGLGNALANIPGGIEEAIGAYEAALRLKPDYAEVHFSLAAALLNGKGRRDEARAHLEAGLRLHPGDAEARRLLERIASSKP